MPSALILNNLAHFANQIFRLLVNNAITRYCVDSLFLVPE